MLSGLSRWCFLPSSGISGRKSVCPSQFECLPTDVEGSSAMILDAAGLNQFLLGGDPRPCAYSSRVLRCRSLTLCIQIIAFSLEILDPVHTVHGLFGADLRLAHTDHGLCGTDLRHGAYRSRVLRCAPVVQPRRSCRLSAWIMDSWTNKGRRRYRDSCVLPRPFLQLNSALVSAQHARTPRHPVP